MYKVKNQIPIGILAFILTLLMAIFFTTISKFLGFFWITGITFGFILQKSRFCFVAALRDPYLIGGVALTKAMLIAFAITTLGFSAIKYGAYLQGQTIPGQNFIVPISVATIIGAIFFGMGMVLAGGCASGTMMRTGEGFQMQFIALIFFIIGSLWAEHDMGWWEKVFISRGKAIFLPDILGWFGALAVQLFVIAFLYVMVDQWESKKSQDF